jgi:hypothetical protein
MDSFEYLKATDVNCFLSDTLEAPIVATTETLAFDRDDEHCHLHPGSNSLSFCSICNYFESRRR